MRKQNVTWAIWSVSRITVILFFVCEGDIMSHLNNETPCGPYQFPHRAKKLLKRVKCLLGGKKVHVDRHTGGPGEKVTLLW